MSYFRPQKSEKPARGASAASQIQLRNCLEKGVGSVGAEVTQFLSCVRESLACVCFDQIAMAQDKLSHSA